MYIVCSCPLKGQREDLRETITVGDEVMPIPPDMYGNGFDGGMMPSGTETYTTNLIDGKWYQETLPMSYDDAREALDLRVGKNSTMAEFSPFAIVHNADHSWEYTILEVLRQTVFGRTIIV